MSRLPPDLTIRPGRPDDAEAVRAFTVGTFAWGDYVGEEFPRWFDKPDSTVIVAADPSDRAIAVAHTRMLSAEEAWLSGARVHPDHRRRGVGTIMNHRGVEWSRERGARVVRLATEEENTPARRQVEKLGYRPVARFVLAVRAFAGRTSEEESIGSDGGRRVPGPERFDLAHSAEADPAYMVWSTGEQARVGHGLYPSDGWAFRRLRPGDVAAAARNRQLWTCPSAWVITEEEEGEMWVPLFITTREDSDRAARALVDLAGERSAGRLAVMVPRVAWLEEALTAERLELAHPNLVYEKAL
jgi:GNAT superfamily N-acetyltransferase